MKNFFRGILIIILIFAMLFGVLLIGYILGSGNNKPQTQTVEISSPITITNGDMEIQNEINLLPTYVINEFSKDGFIDVVTDTEYDNVSGLYYPLNNEIVIDCDYIKYATLHEFGHYVDTKCGYLSETDDFIQIYNQEMCLVSEYCQSDSGEFFAETFKMYLHDELGANLLIYDYMEQLISDIEQNGF